MLNRMINGGRLASTLALIAFYLAAQSLLNEYLIENVLGSDSGSIVVTLLDLFSVNLEASIPTWYSTLLLAASAALLGLIAIVKHKNSEPFARHWAGLALIFLYLSIDEGVGIHELLSDPLQAAFNTTGYLAFAWLIAFVPLLMLFGLLYVRFLLHLSPRVRRLAVAAAVLFVGGAVVVEAISANRWYLDGGVTFPYLAIATVEELFEMLGAVTWLYALLVYVAERGYTAVFHVASTERQEAIRRRVPLWVVAGVIGLNFALGAGVYRARFEGATAAATPSAFYETVADRYAGQGVIILQINEAIVPEQVATNPHASALRTLFADVLIVAFPEENSSIAFASRQLPFSESELTRLLGKQRFFILDETDMQLSAQE